MEIGTPLTNSRYTGNTRGAIYGWDQTLDNAMPRRLAQSIPIANFFSPEPGPSRTMAMER